MASRRLVRHHRSSVISPSAARKAPPSAFPAHGEGGAKRRMRSPRSGILVPPLVPVTGSPRRERSPLSLRSPCCHPERAKRVEGSRPRRTVSFPLPTSIYPPCAFEILRRVPLLRMTHSSRARRGRRPRRPQGPAQCLPRARGRWREAPDEVPAKRNPRPRRRWPLSRPTPIQKSGSPQRPPLFC